MTLKAGSGIRRRATASKGPVEKPFRRGRVWRAGRIMRATAMPPEALQAMTQWAFGQKDVAFVEAETAPDNKASPARPGKVRLCAGRDNGRGRPALRAGKAAHQLGAHLHAVRHEHRVWPSDHFQDQTAFPHGDRHEPRRSCSVYRVTGSEKKSREALRQQRHPRRVLRQRFASPVPERVGAAPSFHLLRCFFTVPYSFCRKQLI